VLVACLVMVAASSTGTAVAGAADPSTPGAPQGNVTPSTRPASGVALVAASAPVDGRVALLLHNGTSRPVRIDRVKATATSSGGALVTGARTSASFPQVLAPDELALATVTFRKRGLGTDPQVAAKVRSTPLSTARAGRVLSVGDLVLSPPQTGAVAQTMRATLTNATASWTAQIPEAAVMCFGEAGTPTTITTARAPARRIRPGKSTVATIELSSLCPTYLVAARAT
jgi:hypothetical protein